MDSLCVGRPGRSYVITAGVCMGKETLYSTHVTKCIVLIYTAHTTQNVIFVFIVLVQARKAYASSYAYWTVHHLDI